MIRPLLLAFLLAFALPTRATAQVDINSADAKTLAESLSGVGLVRAEAIVAYRNANGPFRDIEDLAKVKGIGKKTLETNRNAIVIVDHANEVRASSRASGHRRHTDRMRETGPGPSRARDIPFPPSC